MKRIVFVCTLWVTVVTLGAGLELMVSGGYTNFLFDPSRTTSLQSEHKAFSEHPFVLGHVGIQESVAESSRVTILYERDPVLRNTLYTSLFYDMGFATVKIGPYFGLFNTGTLYISPGLSTTVQIGIPGFMFGTFRADTTLGTGLQVPGDYVQQQSEIGLWIWSPQIITKILVNSRSFSEQKSATLVTKDEVTRYLLVADIFKKSSPYQLTTTFGYQTLTRSYITGSNSEKDVLGALILGLDTSFSVKEHNRLLLSFEMPLYCWGIGGLTSPPARTFFYRGSVGWVVQLGTTILE